MKKTVKGIEGLMRNDFDAAGILKAMKKSKSKTHYSQWVLEEACHRICALEQAIEIIGISGRRHMETVRWASNPFSWF